MPLGRKVADIYAELNLDKDTIRQAMAAAGGEMGADADRLGRQLGDRMSQGMAGQVEQLSTRVAKARLAEQKATDAVALAQARLNEANEKGNVEGSRLLALQQRLSQAESALAIAHDNTAKATTRHADAERQLAADLENLGKDAGPAADRVGRDTGDRLSQGIHLAIIRNSPLIAAGVGAALAFGAPAALAGASALFAGIGIAAAAQSNGVRSAWAGTWSYIRDATQSDSGQISSELEHLAGVTAARFRDMRSEIGAALNDSVPLIDRLATSVLNAADNALPGLTNAVHNAGPAINGLGNLVESTGTGLGKFFDNISSHSPAAGVAFTELGHIVGTLLPLLGEMMGQGVELGSIVLPPLARILDVVAGAAERLAPILPIVSAGFLAFRIVNTVSGWLDLFSAKLQTAAADGGRFTTAIAGGAASGVSKLTGVIGPLIAAVTVVGTLWGESSRQLDDWSQALVDGGQKAATATQQLSDAHSRSLLDAHSLGDAWNIVKGAFADGAAQLQGYDSAQAKASAGARALLAAMDPVSRAQTLQKQALNDLNFALEKHGQGSASAEVAERKYKDASDAVSRAQAAEEQAIHGVTQAMLDQADQAMASIDSTFALQHAQNQQRDAEAALAQAIHDHGKSSVEAHDAEQAYEESIYGTAQAAATLAADQSGLKQGTEEYKNVLDTQLLKSLLAVRDTLSGPARDAVDVFIKTLQDAGVTTDGVGKSADTAGQKLDNLGNKNPKPTIGPATDNVTPQVDNLMNSLFDLGQAHPVPQADLDTKPAERNKDVMIGMLNNLGIQHPTPTADMNLGPFSAATLNALAQVGNLQAQRPTPTAALNTGPLQTSTSFALGQLYNLGATNPTSTASLADRASGPLSSIRAYLNSLDGRVVTTYVNTIGRSVMATGGAVAGKGRGFAGGGVFGPGSGTSDDVAAVGPDGTSYRLSNGEHILTAREVSEMGGQGAVYRFRRLLDSGKLNASALTAAASSASGSAAMSAAPAATGSHSITVQGGITLSFPNVTTIADPKLPRQLVVAMREGIRKLDAEDR